MNSNDTNAKIAAAAGDSIPELRHNPFESNPSDRIPVVPSPLTLPQGMREVGHGNTDARPFDPKDVKSNPTPGE
jgi:hypothetical protein